MYDCEFCSHPNASVDLDKHIRCFQTLVKGTLPTTPKSIEEINEAFALEDVKKSYGCTLQTVDLDGKELPQKYSFFDGAVRNDEKGHSFCVFSSKVTIELIKRHIPLHERHILMDATLRIVPFGIFNQLLILYVRKHRKVCIFISSYRISFVHLYVE